MIGKRVWYVCPTCTTARCIISYRADGVYPSEIACRNLVCSGRAGLMQQSSFVETIQRPSDRMPHDSASNLKEREAVKQIGTSEGWRGRVDAMSDTQVMAIYLRLKAEKKLP